MPDTPPSIAALSDEALKAQTGKGLADWQRILRRFGIRKHGHAAAARHLRERYRLDTATANRFVRLEVAAGYPGSGSAGCCWRLREMT